MKINLQEFERPIVQARWSGIDAARGLAIVLMILDHVLLVVQNLYADRLPLDAAQTIDLVRRTVTRASLPLFMVASGVMLSEKGRNLGRYLEVVGVALVVNVVLQAYPIGFGFPEILGVWCLVMIAAPTINRYPVAAASVGAVQLYVWPIAWGGYQPGLVVLLMVLGVLSGPRSLEWCSQLPQWLRSLGRRPLSWYCGHLAVLVVLHSILS